MEAKKEPLVPTPKDLEIIRLLHETDYGKIVITVKKGEPVHAEVQKSYPL